MKLLIIGHKGMLGTALKEVLKGHQLVLWDLPEYNITDETIIDKMVAENPEVVINVAAFTDVDGAEKHKKEAKAVNADGVAILAEGCEQLNTPLIHISTDYVFDGQTTDGYREDDPPKPINTYGKTKAEGEKKLRKITEAYFLVRTQGLYGPNGKNFVDTMLEKGKAGGEIKIVSDQFIRPTYTFDLARAIAVLIDTQPDYGIYHLVNEGTVSWYEFAKKIFELADMPVKLKAISSKEYKTAAKRPANSSLLNTKFKPLRPWTEALADYLKSKKV
ncbi:MAG: dTDP-4-dehydrorhamnose reductase [Patescibacteria group bacterium]|nr:dTDP-4-dehydrorhamnose reductase [Patescibacteria group bacterium]